MNFRRLLICSLVCATILFAPGCSCGYNDIARAKSPNGNYQAVARSEDCGATALNFMVTLYELPRNDSRGPFLSSPRDEVFHAGYAYHLQIEWVDDSHLQISCPGCSKAEADHQEKSWKGIMIQYVSDRANQSK